LSSAKKSVEELILNDLQLFSEPQEKVGGCFSALKRACTAFPKLRNVIFQSSDCRRSDYDWEKKVNEWESIESAVARWQPYLSEGWLDGVQFKLECA
jgi:hypothetical protein